MQVTFRCPSCDEHTRVTFAEGAQSLDCPHCHTQRPIPVGAVADGKLWQCLACPSTELFVRKDFSQSLGVTIVVIGLFISSVFWFYRMPMWTYGVLFATALADVVLYITVGNVLQCYRCQAQYRGLAGLENHEPFDLETHEKHRQQRIRLEQQAKA